MLTVNQIVLRLILSIILSGLVGLERESIKRPAGFRTHILVSVGSTLIMLVGLYTYEKYKFETQLDPMRLAAQVISGIGFLGAGTIIREGSSVKGLTTAAGLWAVACIGLAIGAGLYLGAVLTATFVLITLIAFRKVEKHIKARRNYMNLRIVSINKPGQLGKIGQMFGNLGVNIANIELDSSDDETVIIKMVVRVPNSETRIRVIENLSKVEGILEVSQST